jgi:pimeloyl-ACP methyl ester carboxylesterase
VSLPAEGVEKTAIIDGTRIHFFEAGKGPCLMLLHGGGPGASGLSNFAQNVPALARHFRVIVPDQPGYGRSDKVIPPAGEARSSFGARLLTGLLGQLGVDRTHLLGNSLGGRTALVMALTQPKSVERMILMGPGGGSFPVLTPEPTEGMKVLQSFYAPPGPTLARMQALVGVMMFDPTKAPPGLAEARFEAAMAPDSKDFFQHYFTVPGVREPELWRDLEKIQHKILLVWGRDDRVLPLEGAFFMMKRLPDARLHVFPRCGHWAQLEWQAEFDRLAVDFLS